jgi:nitroimidazol reductase NimA-like FMN-containing flavoprotein (pyridoxamine 5'-phosphate oxidase superfamily)
VTAQPASERVRLRRKPDRGRYDRATIDAILDAALVGHVGWVLDGQPYVTPTVIWRRGDRLYWHGSVGSRMIQAVKGGARVCVTATILDALVLARSATNHSMDYRSAMVLGEAHAIEGDAATLEALEDLIEHVHPGRWAELRPATSAEIRQTTVVWIDLREASAKIRASGVVDEPDDLSWPVWAGVVPVALVAGTPVAADGVPAELPLPDYLPAAGQPVAVRTARPTDPEA